VMSEVCQWLGIDPELPIKRPRGRPKGAEADEGQVLRVELQSDGSTRGVFIADFEDVNAGTEFHSLPLRVLVSTLGALRQQKLETDADLLEAWLDAAQPDWRERIAGNVDADDTRSASAPDPYDVLGVERAAPMTEVTAAYKRAIKAVHPDVSGASAWLVRAVIDAYRQIRAERKTVGEVTADE
jgi:DnaJ domain